VDQDLYLKLLETGDTKFVDHMLYKYRIHSNGISQHSSKQSAKESFARVIHEAMQRRAITDITALPFLRSIRILPAELPDENTLQGNE